jgi:hypothetical protein
MAQLPLVKAQLAVSAALEYARKRAFGTYDRGHIGCTWGA